jgi:lipid-A-disaccharide synthase-like uncharacterized protein
MSDLSRLAADFQQLLFHMPLWVKIGFLGQALFTARFLVQWLASERKRDSVLPVAFWWLSLSGGIILLAYATHRRDPVIIVGQAMGLVVYTRNLMLVSKAKRRAGKRSKRAENEPAPVTVVIPKPHRMVSTTRQVPWS